MKEPTPPTGIASWRGRTWAVLSLAALLCALGASVLWWRATHINRHGRIPQPAVAVQVPMLMFQAMGRRNGLHCVCMAASPWRFHLQFEPQTYLHEPGYRRAKYVSLAGFALAILSHRSDDSDSILSPFVAVVLPYWFLVALFAFIFCALMLFRWRVAARRSRQSAVGIPR